MRGAKLFPNSLGCALAVAPWLIACDDSEQTRSDASDGVQQQSTFDGSSPRDEGDAGFDMGPRGILDGSQDAGTAADTDGDGAADAFELACGTDPRDPRSGPSAARLVGQGTMVSPFVLCLPEHLDLLALHPDAASAHASVAWDLDFAGRVPPLPLGTALRPFAGVLSGHGHRLSNLDFGLSASPQAGLVEVVAATGLLEDLTIEANSSSLGALVVGTNAGTLRRVTVVGDASGVDHVGMLANVNAASGVIEDCHARGSASASKSHVGGLVGENLGSVRDSSSAAQVSGENRIGGLVGTNGGAVQRSFAEGAVTGSKGFVGGLIGTVRNGGTVRDAYARGEVSAEGAAGGLVGSVQKGGTIERSYARNTVSSPLAQGFLGIDEDMSATVVTCYFATTPSVTDAFATALDASQILLRASYAGFDFSAGTGPWTIVDGQNSPALVRP